MYKFFNFDQLITPTVIKIMYVLSSAAMIIILLWQKISLDQKMRGVNEYGYMLPDYQTASLFPWWRVLLLIMFGLIFIRVVCESLIVIYKICTNTKKIADANNAK